MKIYLRKLNVENTAIRVKGTWRAMLAMPIRAARIDHEGGDSAARRACLPQADSPRPPEIDA